jgi:hypothetical protein
LNPEAGKSIAAAFSLAGFTVAAISGLAVENPVTHTLQCALVSMVFCYFAGLIIGAIALYVAEEHVEKHKAANPIAADQRSKSEQKNVHGAGSP